MLGGLRSSPNTPRILPLLFSHMLTQWEGDGIITATWYRVGGMPPKFPPYQKCAFSSLTPSLHTIVKWKELLEVTLSSTLVQTDPLLQCWKHLCASHLSGGWGKSTSREKLSQKENKAKRLKWIKSRFFHNQLCDSFTCKSQTNVS